MHVERFYPWTMQRSWAVIDNSGRVHSLWIHRGDAEEMVSRLADLWPLEPTYNVPNMLDKGADVWQS